MKNQLELFLKYRKKAKITQNDMAKALDVSPKTLSYWENDKAAITHSGYNNYLDYLYNHLPKDLLKEFLDEHEKIGLLNLAEALKVDLKEPSISDFDHYREIAVQAAAYLRGLEDELGVHLPKDRFVEYFNRVFTDAALSPRGIDSDNVVRDLVKKVS